MLLASDDPWPSAPLMWTVANDTVSIQHRQAGIVDIQVWCQTFAVVSYTFSAFARVYP